MEGLTSTEHAAIERARNMASIAEVMRWADVNSGTDNLRGLATMAGLLADASSVLPGELRLIEPASVEQIGADGAVRHVEHGKHLHLTIRPEAPVQMLFTGHMDTVYPADHAFQTCRMQADGTLNGPGTADMKGGLAVMLAALRAVEASSTADRIGYEIVINADEETGSMSSAPLLAQAARGKIAALTYEPALPDGTLAGARGGSGNFSIVVRGRSAHAGRNPEDGRNALVAAAAIAVRLSKATGRGLSVNPARVDGGAPNNVVPDLAVLRVNFRPQTSGDVARAQAHLNAAVAMVAAEHDVAITIYGGFARPPKPIDAGAARLFEHVRRAGTDLGIFISWAPTGGVCDGNNIAAAGVPVVDTMGVRGGAIHSAEEFMVPESLSERAALSALTVLRIATQGL